MLIELLRNSRDADASQIFVATQCNGDIRSITIVDDGIGIPFDMQARIFEPRVTSKLDTAHMDKWGMHGRGMALYSIAVNSLKAEVVISGRNRGASIAVELDTRTLGEKKDQSSFPHFELQDGVLSMRGPKNLLRVLAEFSLEHRDLKVFYGSPSEIASTLYAKSVLSISPTEKAFRSGIGDIQLCKLLGYADSPAEFASFAADLGLAISERTARRIIDGQIAPLGAILERIENESIANAFKTDKSLPKKYRSKGAPRISKEDIEAFAASVSSAYKTIANKYFLDEDAPAQVKAKRDGLYVHIPFEER